MCQYDTRADSNLYARLQLCSEMNTESIVNNSSITNDIAVPMESTDGENINNEPAEHNKTIEAVKAELIENLESTNHSGDEDTSDFADLLQNVDCILESSDIDQVSINSENINTYGYNVETVAEQGYKCPYCTFWSKTASRFHMHFIGHTAVRPFTCSICSYSSKRKSDINKHIRSKKKSDKSHDPAQLVYEGGELGRGSYAKYNRYRFVKQVPKLRLNLVSESDTSSSTLSVIPTIPSPDTDIAMSKFEVHLVDSVQHLNTTDPSVILKRPLEISIAAGEPPTKKQCEEEYSEHGDARPANSLVHDCSGSTVIKSVSQIRCTSDEDRSKSSESLENGIKTEKSATESQQSRKLRCRLCLFVENDERSMIEHISSHGVVGYEEIMLSMFVISGSATQMEMSSDKFHEGDSSMASQADKSVKQSESAETEVDPKKGYRCSNCPYVSAYKSQLVRHRRFHTLIYGSLKCDFCSYNVSKMHLLIQHKKLHKEKYAQVIAGRVTSIVTEALPKSSLKSVKIIPEKPFKCRFCPSGYTRKSNLNKHEREHTMQESITALNSEFDERIGNLKVGQEESATSHVEEKDVLYFCNECPAHFSYLDDLKSHLSFHSSFHEFRCKSCSFSTSQNVELINHHRVHTNEYKRKTELIMKVFDVSKEHVRPEIVFSSNKLCWVVVPPKNSTQAKVKRYLCPKCPAQYIRKEVWEYHMKMHGSKHKYQCHSCDFRVSYFGNLNKHELVHGLKPTKHPKDAIARTFRNLEKEKTTAEWVNSSLNITEENLSPFKAENRGVRTVEQQETSEKIFYRCRHCPYSHFRKSTVQSHEQCHFNQKGSYVCEFCNYTVLHPHYLRDHQKLHFGTMKGIKPESYMKCDKLEIWMETENGKVLMFKDKGQEENRFEPQATSVDDKSELKKIYINQKTGEFIIYKIESDTNEENTKPTELVGLPNSPINQVSRNESTGISDMIVKQEPMEDLQNGEEICVDLEKSKELDDQDETIKNNGREWGELNQQNDLEKFESDSVLKLEPNDEHATGLSAMERILIV